MVACRRRRYRVASDIHQPEHKADSSPEASRVSLRRGNSCTLSGRNGRRPPLRKNWRIRHAACHRDRNPVNSPSNHRRTFIASPFVFDVPYHYRSCGSLPSARHGPTLKRTLPAASADRPMLVRGENIGLKRTSTSQDSRTPPAKHHRIGGRHTPSRRSENTSQEWPWFRKILSLFTDPFRAGQTFGRLGSEYRPKRTVNTYAEVSISRIVR